MVCEAQSGPVCWTVSGLALACLGGGCAGEGCEQVLDPSVSQPYSEGTLPATAKEAVGPSGLCCQ